MTRPLGWWTISGEDLLEMLRRVHRGEDPDNVYAETYANSDHEWPGGTDDETDPARRDGHR